MASGTDSQVLVCGHDSFSVLNSCFFQVTWFIQASVKGIFYRWDSLCQNWRYCNLTSIVFCLSPSQRVLLWWQVNVIAPALQCKERWGEVHITLNRLELVKGELINMTQAWNKEKNLSPWQESNPWPPENWTGTLSTELQELMESKFI